MVDGQQFYRYRRANNRYISDILLSARTTLRLGRAASNPGGRQKFRNVQFIIERNIIMPSSYAEQYKKERIGYKVKQKPMGQLRPVKVSPHKKSEYKLSNSIVRNDFI